jgi:hypothetical protein
MTPKLIWFQTKAIAITVSHRKPVNTTEFVVAHTVLQVIFNTTIACLPSKKIWKLGIPRKQKIPLVLILFLGFLTVIATICGGMYRLAALTSLKSSSNWARAELAASIEISVGVVCSSFPAWKQLWNRWFQTYEYAQNSYSTGVLPGERKNGLSSLELGKVESTEEAANTFGGTGADHQQMPTLQQTEYEASKPGEQEMDNSMEIGDD